MTDIVLVGGGGHGKVVLAALLRSPDFRVVGYTDPTDHGSPLLGVARLGHDDVLPAVAAEFPGAGAAIGVGMLGSTTVRRRLEAMLDRLGLSLPVIRASSAIVHADVAIGDGTFVGDGVVVNPSARIGRCAILNTRCVVEHDVVVGAHAHIAPGATLCGGAAIGDDCWIGANAVVSQCKRVERGCIVGAGAVVVTDLREPGTYVGVPARRVA
jgi:UDP-perosamine 4-acetyltransferase